MDNHGLLLQEYESKSLEELRYEDMAGRKGTAGGLAQPTGGLFGTPQQQQPAPGDLFGSTTSSTGTRTPCRCTVKFLWMHWAHQSLNHSKWGAVRSCHPIPSGLRVPPLQALTRYRYPYGFLHFKQCCKSVTISYGSGSDF